MTPGPGTMAHRVIEWLRARPDGASADDISSGLRILQRSAETALTYLRDMGAAVGIREPKGRATQRKRWYAVEHAPVAKP